MFDWMDTLHGPTDREIEEYKFQIKGGHVPISETYLATIPPRFYSYYVFLVLYTSLSPSLNPTVLAKYIDALMTPAFTNKNCDRAAFKESIVSALNIVLQDLPSCILVFQSILSFLFRYVVLSSILETELGYIEWILEIVLLENDAWKQLLYCTQPLKLYMEKRKVFLTSDNVEEQVKNLIHSVLDPMVIPTLQMFNVVHASRVAGYLQPHKEEIIASACHPRRMHRFLDMGYTLEEVLNGMD